ncbi:MAG: YggT family protein [Zetaproteobacteria bacterium]|nr:MAG: YggT family protein [Zetaproteobacteria bacterium]
MFMLGYFLQALAGVVHVLLMAVMLVVIARAVLSWVSPDPYNPIVRVIIQLSEPLLYPIRRRLPIMGGLDLSPMLLILAAVFLDNFLVPSLQRIALNMFS